MKAWPRVPRLSVRGGLVGPWGQCGDPHVPLPLGMLRSAQGAELGIQSVLRRRFRDTGTSFRPVK